MTTGRTSRREIAMRLPVSQGTAVSHKNSESHLSGGLIDAGRLPGIQAGYRDEKYSMGTTGGTHGSGIDLDSGAVLISSFAVRTLFSRTSFAIQCISRRENHDENDLLETLSKLELGRRGERRARHRRDGRRAGARF